MKIFLTGINGFIGKHLAKRLVEDGHTVHCVFGSRKIDWQDWCNGISFVDSFYLKKEQYDYVIHLAATTTISKEFNADIFFNNVIFAQQILSSPFRTIYASSTSIYDLNNPYAYTKAFNEHLGNRHGNALGLRFFNVYGPGNNKGIVKRAIDCCMSSEPIKLSGGDQVRDFIFIDDVIDIIVEHLDNPLQVMDVGTGIGTQVSDVVDEIRAQFNYSAPLVVSPSNYEGEQMVSVARSMPLKNYTPLREGLKRTIEDTLKQVI